MHKNQHQFGYFLVLALLFLAIGAKPSENQEQDLLLNSPAFGNFEKARKERPQEKVALQIWEQFAVRRDQLPQAVRDLLLKGQDSLEVDADEVWVAERQDFFHLRNPGGHRGDPDLVKLYWKDGQVQALTVEKFYTMDPVTWEKLPKPGYKVILIYPRPYLFQETAKQEAADQAFQNLSPAAHLEEAIRALGEGNPEAEDLKKRTYGRLADARKQLEAIPKKAEESDEARKLLKEVERREKDLKKFNEVMQESSREHMIQQREALVRELDRDFLNKGMDVKIGLRGPDKTNISMDCLVFSRPMVYVFVDKTDLLKNLRNAGFQEVIFSNNKIAYSWRIDLNNM